MYFSNYLG